MSCKMSVGRFREVIQAPKRDSSGIFWDNDSLSTLLALELKADLLVLLSDVEGLYSGPPDKYASLVFDMLGGDTARRHLIDLMLIATFAFKAVLLQITSSKYSKARELVLLFVKMHIYGFHQKKLANMKWPFQLGNVQGVFSFYFFLQETLLVHEHLLKTGGLNDFIVELRSQGVILYGGPRASTKLIIPAARSLHYEYNSLACTVEIVDDLFAAIDHIHHHGSFSYYISDVIGNTWKRVLGLKF
ncbi:hypothetical protein J5N97_008337 [Dioscorea zingiberensis]|uniref:Aspartate/glutamate/uridylate kinase domain-containing protein n=1 Tax=Dioscorea zingiberensis TaxID=325984 RepID=A0A9D5CWR5_9LILI|nr:hypothetical protein J5N97_008337 [Dioscorea zingiberensis]